MHSTIAAAIEPEANAKARIFTVATSLFAQSGLDAVPLRDIARDAGVNGAAINYYFGTKDELIREIFRKLLGEVNRLRLEALDACETAGKGKKLDPEHVIRALVEPMVRFSSMQEGEGKPNSPGVQASGVRRDFVDQSIAEQSDHIALRFVAALGAALPQTDKEEVFWRFDFAVGACQHILLEQQRSHRLSRLSKGLCDTKDVERVIDQLVASILGSFLAKAPQKRQLGQAKWPTRPFATKEKSQSRLSRDAFCSANVRRSTGRLRGAEPAKLHLPTQTPRDIVQRRRARGQGRVRSRAFIVVPIDGQVKPACGCSG